MFGVNWRQSFGISSSAAAGRSSCRIGKRDALPFRTSRITTGKKIHTRSRQRNCCHHLLWTSGNTTERLADGRTQKNTQSETDAGHRRHGTATQKRSGQFTRGTAAWRLFLPTHSFLSSSKSKSPCHTFYRRRKDDGLSLQQKAHPLRSSTTNPVDSIRQSNTRETSPVTGPSDQSAVPVQALKEAFRNQLHHFRYRTKILMDKMRHEIQQLVEITLCLSTFCLHELSLLFRRGMKTEN